MAKPFWVLSASPGKSDSWTRRPHAFLLLPSLLVANYLVRLNSGWYLPPRTSSVSEPKPYFHRKVKQINRWCLKGSISHDLSNDDYSCIYLLFAEEVCTLEGMEKKWLCFQIDPPSHQCSLWNLFTERWASPGRKTQAAWVRPKAM